MSSHSRKPINGILIAIAIALIAMATIIWVLNITDVIKGPWSSIFGAIFASAGVLIALVQLYPQFTTDSTSPLPQSPQPTHNTPDEDILLTLPSGQEGQLRVYATKALRGYTVDLCRGFGNSRNTDVAENIVGQKIKGRTYYMAIFHSLSPGSYSAHIYKRERMARVTILAGQVAVIDWR